MRQSRYPKDVVLKDGRQIVLRPLVHEDSEALCRFYGSMDQRLLWYMKEEPFRPEVIGKWLNYQDSGEAFSVVSEFNKQVVGHISLLMRPHGGWKHVGRLKIYLADDFGSKQLGTWMAFDMIKYAMEIGLEMLRADFIVGLDDAAIDALRKLDFHSEGRFAGLPQGPGGEIPRCGDYDQEASQRME